MRHTSSDTGAGQDVGETPRGGVPLDQVRVVRRMRGRELPEVPDLWSLLEAALNLHSSRPALYETETGNESSYADLLALTEALSSTLIQRAASAGDKLIVDLRPGLGEVVGVLAAVRSGVGFVGIPTGQEPTSSWVSATGARIVLTERPELWESLFPGIEVLSWTGEVVPPTEPHEPVAANADALCYLASTSGTSGDPLLVMTPRRGVARLALGADDYTSITSQSSTLRFAPLAFDASTFELFVPLLRGARIVALDMPDLDLGKLAEVLVASCVDVAWLTSGLFGALAEAHPDAFRRLREVVTGGDVVDPVSVRKARKTNAGLRVVNGYGPTEITTFATAFVADPSVREVGPLPIGRPIPGTDLAITADGELLVSGDGLALGYLDQLERTNERFVQVDGVRYFRTGDLVAWDEATDLLYFQGRNDRQVKVRGFRIEPSDIDDALSTAPMVRTSWTFANGDGASRELVCALVTDSHDVTPEKVREFLAGLVPPHAMPNRFVVLDAIPLTSVGKVDTRAIANHRTPAPQDGVGAPDDSMSGGAHAIVRRSWEDQLGHSEFEDDESFFDAGGDSLRLARLHSSLQKLFSSSQVRLVDLFESTLR